MTHRTPEYYTCELGIAHATGAVTRISAYHLKRSSVIWLDDDYANRLGVGRALTEKKKTDYAITRASAYDYMSHGRLLNDWVGAYQTTNQEGE
eukprot:7171263-Pyramimonas_sp.AAC.1